ncbi:MAG: sulfite exporter TauE/SafE family protein [Mogibacterium sp.]|nr:sulfite exporter TauE/SafE family protein [Mogibacterium sp.]
MGLLVLRAISLAGIVLCVILMLRKQKVLLASPDRDPVTGMTFEETWKQGLQKKNLISTIIIGIVANFFDTLGIGSFAPSTTAFKLTKSVDDVNIPGTLNVGDTVPVCVEAFLFFGLIEMDILTLVCMIVASVVGAYVAAGVVSKFNRKKVRYAMFVAMFILATIMLCKQMGVGPFGEIGTEVGLRGAKLIIAIVCNFVLGALMSIGVGLYAPCMALCVLLGLDTRCAFPAMMGSCAFLMAFGNGPKFIQEGRYDPIACWTQAIGGAIGVFMAYYIVGSMDVRTLTWVVIAVCYITSFIFLHDGIKKGEAY